MHKRKLDNTPPHCHNEIINQESTNDDDFESNSFPTIPLTNGNTTLTNGNTIRNNNINNVSTCPICLNKLTLQGPNKITAISCGHLFCKSCISTYFKLHKKSRNCPHCKQLVKPKYLFELYTNNISAIDIYEKEKYIKTIEELNKKLFQKKLENENLLQKERTLLKNITKASEKIKIICSSDWKENSSDWKENTFNNIFNPLINFMQSTNSNIVCKEENMSENINGNDINQNSISKTKGSLVLNPLDDDSNCKNHNKTLNNFAISDIYNLSSGRICKFHTNNCLLVSQGKSLSKLSLLEGNIIEETLTTHNNTIRGVDSTGKLIASVGIDKFLQINDFFTCERIISYQSNAPLWSCNISCNNLYPFHIFCGSHNGIINIYDIRVSGSSKPYQVVTLPSSSPVHSLKSSPYGILIGTMDCCYLYKLDKGLFKLKLDGLNISSITSLDYDLCSCKNSTEFNLLVTQRSSHKAIEKIHARHAIFHLTENHFNTLNSIDGTIPIVTPLLKCILNGFSNHNLLSSSVLFSYDQNSYVSSGNESENNAIIWNLNNSNDNINNNYKKSFLLGSHQSPVLSLSVGINSEIVNTDVRIASVSNNSVYIYNLLHHC